MEPWIGAPATFLLLGLGLYCHRHWHALFAEDPPQEIGRRRHAQATPMTGWVPALVILAALALTARREWLLAGIGLATLVGYFDDRGKVEGAELAWHLKGLALGVAAACVTFDLAAAHGLSAAQAWYCLGWLFLLTNAVNFMDNTDGVAASVGGMGLLLATGGEGPLAWAGWAMLGFLPFNWPRARMFLGDAGSLSLGICLATASLEAGLRTGSAAGVATSIDWGWAALPLLVFAADFVQVVTARLILGVPPWLGDRRHLTHVSMNLGLPRVMVAPVFAGLGYLAFGLLAR
jgi:UDP-N-acetylmuramyl pentapeptide phosphotransferase/UDP-N-acetylglucosamine-1-phosphate transferase